MKLPGLYLLLYRFATCRSCPIVPASPSPSVLNVPASAAYYLSFLNVSEDWSQNSIIIGGALTNWLLGFASPFQQEILFGPVMHLLQLLTARRPCFKLGMTWDDRGDQSMSEEKGRMYTEHCPPYSRLGRSSTRWTLCFSNLERRL